MPYKYHALRIALILASVSGIVDGSTEGVRTEGVRSILLHFCLDVMFDASTIW